jgi:hypothetical protein
MEEGWQINACYCTYCCNKKGRMNQAGMTRDKPRIPLDALIQTGAIGKQFKKETAPVHISFFVTAARFLPRN